MEGDDTNFRGGKLRVNYNSKPRPLPVPSLLTLWHGVKSREDGGLLEGHASSRARPRGIKCNGAGLN